MNDEFLHALRRDPPPEFASELKRRLLRQPARRSVRSSFMRTMLALFLIGGVAMAAALLLRDRPEPPAEAAPIAQATAPKPVAPLDPPERTPPAEQPVVHQPSPTPPQATEAEPKEIPIALTTSELARPLAQALVERVAKFGFEQPRLMTMEDDEAFRALCGNADFSMVSRRISQHELAQCQRWGIDIVEWKLGYQAVVLTAAPTTELQALTPREAFLALARRIPDPAEPSRLIDNPHATWHDVDNRFEYRTIHILMPSDATTRAAFQRLVMEPGCETYPWIRQLRLLDRPRYDDICHQLRSDGRLREVGLTSTVITQHLWAEPNWVIVLGYTYYARYRTELLALLEGPAPTLASLSDGTYSAGRPVYVYAQRKHLEQNPAARRLAQHLSDESALGPHAYLGRVGLVPLNELPRQMPPRRPQLPPTLESLQP